MGSIRGARRGKYSTHNIQPTNKVYCWKCNKVYKRKAILEHHIRTKHLNYHAGCPVCHKQYVSVSVCNRHLKRVHNVSSYSHFNVKLKNDLDSAPDAPISIHKDTDIVLIPEILSFESDKAFPCVANVLKLNENHKFGKHIIANCDIDVGKFVMITPAFASIEYVTCTNLGCFQCGKIENYKRIQCPHCINVWFCSKRCSLSEMHRKKCNKMYHYTDCRTVRLVTEIITMALKSVSDAKTLLEYCRGILFFNKKLKSCQSPYSTYGEIIRLKGIPEKIHFPIAQRVVKHITTLPQFDGLNSAEFQRILFHLAYRHTICIALNAFSEEIVLGKGGTLTRFAIYGILSRFNHSCAPNIHHYIDENNITYCVVIRPIKKGEQAFINYLSESQFDTTQERQSYIKENWQSECGCEKCSLDFSVCDELHPLYCYIERNWKQYQCNNGNQLKQECISYLSEFGHSWSNAVDFIVRCLIAIINKS